MNDRRDLELVLDSSTPIVVIETTDEERFLGLLTQLAVAQPAAGYRPLFRWSVTDGLQRLDLDLEPQRHNAAPEDVLRHIRSVHKPGIYALLDFHPFLNDPVNVRLLKDIAIDANRTKIAVLLIGHRIELPEDLKGLSARFSLRLPNREERLAIVNRCLDAYREEHGGRVRVDPAALELLVTNLSGLTHADTERLARNAIHHDGAITANDVPAVMQAKYQLLNRGGVLSFEYETAHLSQLAGFRNVKVWLQQRRAAFRGDLPPGLDPPSGLLLIGVQGCGKSVAAKAAAGIFGVAVAAARFRRALQQVLRRDRAQSARVAADGRGHEPLRAVARRDREGACHRQRRQRHRSPRARPASSPGWPSARAPCFSWRRPTTCTSCRPS